MAAKRTRMSASERREQLIAVARGLFAERGFDATSVEEVAARAQVSKPVVYEHFGGKEGLYHRFYQAVRTSCSPEELLETAKTKRYPTSRLRRMLLSAWLDVTPPAGGIPYLRVLAANERGRDLLRQMQRQGAPVLTRPGDVSRLGPAAETLFRQEALWTDLYVLTYPQASRSVCGSDWRTNPILL